MSNKPEDDIELSLEEYEELMEELEEFDEKAFMLLAGSHRYEIIPTITEDGKVLTSKELKMLTDECKKRGFATVRAIRTGIWHFEIKQQLPQRMVERTQR